MAPILRLRRSAQSGSYAMAAAYTVVYTENTATSLLAYIFGGAFINLTPMLAGDSVDIRLRKVVVSGGAWVAVDTKNYLGAPPAGHPGAIISAIPDVFGVEIAMRQTAGVLRTFECEFFDAKRLGLA